MLASTHVLLEAIFDYAGTFPPASLPLADALSNYARDRTSAEHWLLGRLVLPAASLPEFERLARSLPPVGPKASWDLTVILGVDPADQLDKVLSFNRQTTTGARVASIEFSPLRPGEIRDLKGRIPETIEAFFETPFDADVERRLDAIAVIGRMAKVRTGGVTAGGFPNAESLVRFLGVCADAGIAFKATAGLHHAVRGCYALRDEPGSETATMHGFLNVCVAAALVRTGAGASEAVDALVESSADPFQFGAGGVAWRDRTLTNDDLAATRRHFFRSFGSCAFREPVDELARLRLL
jgi:hypothetical protein